MRYWLTCVMPLLTLAVWAEEIEQFADALPKRVD